MTTRIFLPGLFVASLSIGFAQVDRATLAGSVEDSAGRVIPGAKVEAVSQETGFRRETQMKPNGVCCRSSENVVF